jgi:hypothetical protein
MKDVGLVKVGESACARASQSSTTSTDACESVEDYFRDLCVSRSTTRSAEPSGSGVNRKVGMLSSDRVGEDRQELSTMGVV